MTIESKQKSMAELSLKQMDLTIQAVNESIRYAKRFKKIPRIVKRKKYKGNPLKFFGIAMQVAILQRQKEKIAASF